MRSSTIPVVFAIGARITASRRFGTSSVRERLNPCGGVSPPSPASIGVHALDLPVRWGRIADADRGYDGAAVHQLHHHVAARGIAPEHVAHAIVVVVAGLCDLPVVG